MSAKQQFSDTFLQAPESLGRAWGRVNLIGEHLDYNGGMVLPAPIGRSIEVAIGPAQADRDKIQSNLFTESVSRGTEFKLQGDWSDYVCASLSLARKLGLLDEPISVSIYSDIPHGAGVSSSAALVVASLRAVLGLSQQKADTGTVARWAQIVENDYIGVPCGIMDQIAVSITELGQAIALDTNTLEHALYQLPDDCHFSVIFSGLRRQLDEGRYALRRQECEAAARELAVPLLCKMSGTQSQNINHLKAPLRGRARHVYSEHHRVLHAIDALRENNMTMFGKLMNLSHESMRDDFEISVPVIDALVESCREYGALGARMTGGGFGGCVVACVAKSELAQWSAKLLAAHPQARIIA